MSVNPVAIHVVIALVLIGLALFAVGWPATSAEQLAPTDMLNTLIPLS